METSSTINEIIALGNDLVALMRKRQQPDLLSEWMAHHVAACIAAARLAKGRAKAAAESRCVTTILQLWRHRAAMPEGHRPFENFEPILATLARLNPENVRNFYFDFPSSRKHSGKPDAPPKLGSVEHYVDIAAKLDQAARVMIEHFLSEATGAADQPATRKLLKRCIHDRDGADIVILRRILEAKDVGAAMVEASRTFQERRLRDRIERLDSFLSVAVRTRRDYQEKLRLLCKHKPKSARAPKRPAKPMKQKSTPTNR